MNERHTITINQMAFEILRKKGVFGESYSEVILRLVRAAELEEPINNG
jgi:predicted CopG family antitoxin